MSIEIMRVKGISGTLIIFEDKIYIERKSLLGNIDALVHKTPTGYYSEKEIRLNTLEGVEWNRASMIRNGYISLFVKGEIKNMGGLKGAFNDASSIIIYPNHNKDAKKAIDYLYNVIKENKEKEKHVVVDNNIECNKDSIYNELIKLKELYDKNIINDEEFKDAKQKVLK